MAGCNPKTQYAGAEAGATMAKRNQRHGGVALPEGRLKAVWTLYIHQVIADDQCEYTLYGGVIYNAFVEKKRGYCADELPIFKLREIVPYDPHGFYQPVDLRCGREDLVWLTRT